MDKLNLHIECLIFISGDGVTRKELQESLAVALDQKFSESEILTGVDSIREKYLGDQFPFELVEIGGKFQFATKGAYFNTAASYLKVQSSRKLTRAAMETLAIVAYRQPVTKSTIEQIRGVNADYTLQKLLEKDLVEITGREEGPGRPLLYSTSEKFMNHFGLRDISDLPKLKEFKLPDEAAGEPAPILDDYVPGKNEEE